MPLPAAATLDDLLAVFPDRADRPRAEPVPAAELPEPYHGLLAHAHHMTVTVEEFYGGPVDVRVLAVAHAGDDYAREILLALRETGRVVQFGIVRIDLAALSPTVRAEIVGRRTPLGRVLIQHDVLRTIEPTGFFRVRLDPVMAGWFGCPAGAVTYGRIGVITADGRPAVRVAEILAPVPT